MMTRTMARLSRRDGLKLGVAMAAPGTAAAAMSVSANAQNPGPGMPFRVASTTIPIVGTTDVFPVRRIYCIGRNYAAHSREMGSDPTREPPFFFQKPTDAIQFVAPGTVGDHPYPSLTKNYHYEVELVAALKAGGKDIPIERALDLVYGYALGLDMTRRDLQRLLADEKKALGNRQVV
jgi:2-keto-4-pentenoate hydratase/2-oxohepta-3-ene-1,7-dioic acid hydratase in catechol pathway